MSINPSDYERIFAEFCFDLSNESGSVETIMNNYKKKLFALVKNNDLFIERFTDLCCSSRDKGLVSYILDGILKHYDKGIQVASPTIEHILPKSPKKWGLEKDDIKDYVDNIGNLTLLYRGDNQDLQNSTMKDKIEKVFSKSKFKLNRSLRNKEEAFKTKPKEAIEKRALELAVIAAKVWGT